MDTVGQAKAVDLQPFLVGAVVVVRAPSQAWSAADGGMGRHPIEGFYHCDTRLFSGLGFTVAGSEPECIAHAAVNASAQRFVSLVRNLDERGVDPRLRVDRLRTVGNHQLTERFTITSAMTEPVTVPVRIELVPDFGTLQAIKAGAPARSDQLTFDVGDTWIGYQADGVTARVDAAGATVQVADDGSAVLEWLVPVLAGGSADVSYTISANDPAAVVAGVETCWRVQQPDTDDPRLKRWLSAALSDLDALRLTTVSDPTNEFLAAGAPWFLTLFGRDSIWAARMILPVDVGLAAGTLRALAGLQGRGIDPDTAEQPGKIMHELRSNTVSIPGENVSLPPLYYGTVDATALWVCLLHDGWKAGMALAEVRELAGHLEAALAWMRDFGDSDGDGFLEYVDLAGHGLANQGWKDSADSIQWRDGTLADGPIALCEVQGYAYEAAVHGADLLDALGLAGGDACRVWAARLKSRFAEEFWIDSAAGAYPAVALDAVKRRVDTVTSNMGHLLGTGILDAEGARLVARRLVSPELSSGYGLRTMSTDSAGYWPLSYHGGTVWTHDTAIAISGLVREGFVDEARTLAQGLLAAAETFDFRMPELHSGDAASDVARAIPYPAACRPQAWSAAAAVAVHAALTTPTG